MFDWDDQERQLQEEVNRYEKSLDRSKQIAQLARKKAELQKKVEQNMKHLPQAGSLTRAAAVLSPFSGVMHGIYNANEATKTDASIKAWTTQFAKSYAQSVANAGKTAWTGCSAA